MGLLKAMGKVIVAAGLAMKNITKGAGFTVNAGW